MSKRGIDQDKLSDKLKATTAMIEKITNQSKKLVATRFPKPMEGKNKKLIIKRMEGIKPSTRVITDFPSYISLERLHKLYDIDEYVKVIETKFGGSDPAKLIRQLRGLVRGRYEFKKWCGHFSTDVFPPYIMELEKIKEDIDKTNSELEELSKPQKWSEWFDEKGLSVIGSVVGFFGF